MTEIKKSKYLEEMREKIIALALGHGTNDNGAGEIADFFVDKLGQSFRNGIHYGKNSSSGDVSTVSA